MQLVPLTPDYPLTAFDCGDEDLNKFLLDDAKPSQELRIANTFILEAEDGRIAAYFCLLSDKVSKNEVIGSRWKKVRSLFPKGKQFKMIEVLALQATYVERMLAFRRGLKLVFERTAFGDASGTNAQNQTRAIIITKQK